MIAAPPKAIAERQPGDRRMPERAMTGLAIRVRVTRAG
jgi:hypothetical protein